MAETLDLWTLQAGSGPQDYPFPEVHFAYAAQRFGSGFGNEACFVGILSKNRAPTHIVGHDQVAIFAR